MSALFVPAGPTALRVGDTILSTMGFEGRVSAVVKADESHGDTEHWHVTIRNSDPVAAVLFGESTDVPAGIDDMFMVKVFVDDLDDVTRVINPFNE